MDVVDFDLSALNDLTIEEIEMVEDIIDAPIDELSSKGMKKGKVLRALAYINARRTNPEFTLEEAGKFRVRGDDSPFPNGGAPTDESNGSKVSSRLPKQRASKSAT
jgi:hypothetical protein